MGVEQHHALLCRFQVTMHRDRCQTPTALSRRLPTAREIQPSGENTWAYTDAIMLSSYKSHPHG